MKPSRVSAVWGRLLCAAVFLLAAHCASTAVSSGIPYTRPGSDQIARVRAEEVFIRARDLERRGLREDALELYIDASKLDPGSKVLRDIIVSRYIETGRYTPALLLVKGRKKNQDLGPEEKRMVAEIYLRMRDFPKAIETIESIKDKNGADYYSLAVIYEALGEDTKALRCYTAFSSLSPVSLEIGLKICRMQLLNKKYADADSLVSRLEQRLGENPLTINIRGMLSLAKGDTASAMECFTTAVAADSLFDEGVRNIALLYLQKNDYQNAIINYEKLYRRSQKPFQEVYGRTLAVLYYYNKQYKNAESIFETLCQSMVNDYELHYYLGLVYAAQQNNEMAWIELEKSLALRNDFYEAWRELAALLIREEDTVRALSTAARYTGLFPNNPDAWRLQGYVQSQIKAFAQAIAAYTKAVALDSLNSATLFDLGSAYERNKDVDNAARTFRKVLKLKPGDATTSNYLGYMWADNGIRLDSAKVLIEDALRQDPGNGAYLDSYAWVHYRQGNIDSALVYQEKAASRIDDDPVVYEHLGDILRRLKKNREALDAYKKSIELHHESPEAVRRKIIELEPSINHENP